MNRSTDWAHGFSSDTSLLFVVPNWFVTAVLVWQVTHIFLNVTSASTCKRINTNKLSKWELWDQNFNKTSHDVRLYPQKMDAICMMYTQRHLTCQLGQAEAAQQGKAVLQLWAPDSSPFLGWAPLCKLALCMHLNISVWDNCDREISYTRFVNHSLAKQLAINITDGALAIPTASGKFALTTSGRLRIVFVSSLTLGSFQIRLNKAMKLFYLFILHILPLRSWSFLFWLSLTVSSANCSRTTKMLYYGVVMNLAMNIHLTNPHNSQGINPGILEQRMHWFFSNFFLEPKFKLKNCFW